LHSPKKHLFLYALDRLAFPQNVRTMPDHAPIILPHGGYRHLKSFQVAELLYDVTVQFCDRFKERRCQTLAEVRQWVAEERNMQEQNGMRTRTSTDLHGPTRTECTAHAPAPVRAGPCRSVPVRATPPDRPLPSAVLAANAALSLLNLACLLLDRQLASLEQAFAGVGAP
jgi:hypothetical protein